MQEQLGDFSNREKNLWFELLVDIVVALYYWPKAIGLMMAGDEALRGAAMVGLITNTVILAVVVSVILSLLLGEKSKPEPMDERDLAIANWSALLSGRVLTGCIMLVMGQVVMQEMMPAYIAERGFTVTPLLMAHLLLVALMLASSVGTLARLYRYRCGA